MQSLEESRKQDLEWVNKKELQRKIYCSSVTLEQEIFFLLCTISLDQSTREAEGGETEGRELMQGP